MGKIEEIALLKFPGPVSRRPDGGESHGNLPRSHEEQFGAGRRQAAVVTSIRGRLAPGHRDFELSAVSDAYIFLH